MSILKKRQLKELNNDDLVKRLQELKLELAKERAQIAIGGSPSNTGRVGQTRRTIAKLITEKNKRRL
ncbi:MAG: 50S ribosomal protein L29 [Nanoarchaeota archaeon]|nr:50S ribosomal protein L29 [Nanoarchaeota archaeon]